MRSYKKIAGTVAVFVLSQLSVSSAIERDGLSWSFKELHLDSLPLQKTRKPTLATLLALEGLEDYEPPTNGDIRRVESINSDFVYSAKMRGWAQI